VNACKASLRVIVSIVLPAGIGANFGLVSSVLSHIWSIGQNLPILAIIFFQLCGSIQISLSEITLSVFAVWDI
jgi:hypothetical protein